MGWKCVKWIETRYNYETGIKYVYILKKLQSITLARTIKINI
jgi:hypothetical protein